MGKIGFMGFPSIKPICYGKTAYVLTSDGSHNPVSVHLTGIKSNVCDDDFFTFCRGQKIVYADVKV